jgi:YfiH family protein
MTRSMPMLPPSWHHHVGLIAGFGGRRNGPSALTVYTARQVHGTKLFRVQGLNREPPPPPEADALVAEGRGVVVAVATADCVPVLLIEPSGRWAAAVHAGWRGTVAGAVAVATEAASADGVAVSSLYAALGPAIGPCCYEIGEEVAEKFMDAGLPVQRNRQSGRLTADLRACNREILLSRGCRPERIRAVGPCTRCHHEDFHSFRADRDKAGRQLSWVGWADRDDETDAQGFRGRFAP